MFLSNSPILSQIPLAPPQGVIFTTNSQFETPENDDSERVKQGYNHF
jgi:hypothetical protein